MISPGRDENKNLCNHHLAYFQGGELLVLGRASPTFPFINLASPLKTPAPWASAWPSRVLYAENLVSHASTVSPAVVTHHRKAGRAFLSFLLFVSVRWKIMLYHALPITPKKQFVCLVNFSPMETWFKKTTTHFLCLLNSILLPGWIYSGFIPRNFE